MKFSIVTPSFNSARYISETIESVISQKGDFEIEYIIVDNNSSDRTREIVNSYRFSIESGLYKIRCIRVTIRLHCSKDRGMYDAINRGFDMATGDIYAWINSDDIYLPGAFNVMAKVFKVFNEIRWLKGITSYINESSTIFEVGPCFMYDQNWIQKGMYGREAFFIQQDSVFWRSELWKVAGGIDADLKLAGDYSLWIKFSNYTPLYTVKAYVSCFRKSVGQLSCDFDSYIKEYEKICIPHDHPLAEKIVLFTWLGCHTWHPLIQKIVSRFFFGRQSLYLIELSNGEKPVLKKVAQHTIK